MSCCRDFAEDLESLPRETAVVHLRLMATSDLHAALLPYDYYTDEPAPGTGMLSLWGLLADERATTPNTLLFDNGDTLQGTPLGDVAAESLASDNALHPIIAAMNAMGYDAATLGNHDFDFGITFLNRALDDADFPIVLANARRADTGAPYRGDTVILTREVEDLNGNKHALRIGVTGTVPPQVALWNRITLGGSLIFTDAIEASRRAAADLKTRGADIVVVLAHSGLGAVEEGSVTDPLGPENAARAIAALPNVDAVVAGHTHEVFPKDADCCIRFPRRPIVQPGYQGSHLGCIDLALSSDGADAPTWRVRHAHVRALPVTGATRGTKRALRGALRTAPLLRERISSKHRATRRFTSRDLGATAVPITTYFSLAAPCAATQLIADAQRFAAETLIEADPDLRDLPLLSAAAPMRSGGRAGPSNFTDIPRGKLVLRHMADLYSYPNHLAILRMTGASVADWLERSASAFLQIDPDNPASQSINDPAFASYNFDRIDGLTYDIDLSKPARTNAAGDLIFPGHSRVSNIRFSDGTLLLPQDEVLVATNTYRAGGGGNFAMMGASDVVRTGLRPIRDDLADYVRKSNEALETAPRSCFNLIGCGQARPVLLTGPGAVSYPSLYEELDLTPCCMFSDGFQRFMFNDARPLSDTPTI